MKAKLSMADILRDWPAFLDRVFLDDPDDFFVASDALDRRLATLGRILANPKTKNAARFVVTCPRGDPMLRVYIIEGEPMFVPALTLQLGLNAGVFYLGDDDPGTVPDEEPRRVAWAADQLRRQIAQLGDTVQAQCKHRFRQIPRGWLLAHIEAGSAGAIFDD